ncbi:MAG: CbtA family protein [Rubrobacter sp.]|nr:CbtA family protein [Rubrobacter sp.]
MFATFLHRGMAAGLLAGLLCGFFAFFLGEPVVDGAIQVEEATAADHQMEASANHGHEEIFSRSTQKVGLLFATSLFGVTVGGIFGMVYAYFRSRLLSNSEWSRSLSLTSAAFFGVFLIPFLKYPANPPGVGSPETIGSRTTEYFAMVTLSLVVVVSTWYVARELRARGMSTPVRQLVVALGSVVVIGVLYSALPAGPDPGEFPAGLLWDFRLSSLGTQVIFWAGLGVIFGFLNERYARKAST